MRDPRIPPFEDPTPITPRSAVINTDDLPEYAKTAEEWWQITDTIWPAILDIADRVGSDADDRQRLEVLRTNRDKGLAALFDSLWELAPDAGFIHTWPQWNRFCDLCSERYVLDPEAGEEED